MTRPSRATPEEPQLLGELFTATNLSNLAWYGSTSLLVWAANTLSKRGLVPSQCTTGQVLDAAFSVLECYHPNEYVYKTRTLEKTVFGRYSPRTTSFYTEFPVAGSRADILLINGSATVYEIKTPLDTFSRLNTQLSDYYRCFTRAILLTDETRARTASSELPAYVGIASLTKRGQIHTVRDPVDHAHELRQSDIFALLRKSEYVRLSRDLGIPTDEVHPADLYSTCLKAFETLTPAEAHAAAVAALQRRQCTEGIAAVSSRLPRSLRVAAFAFRLPRRDWNAIIARQGCVVPGTGS
jgi:hypothetical protein